MNTRTLLTPALLCALGALTSGATSRWELTGGLLAADLGPVDAASVLGQATYYIDPLSATSPEPLAEAAFVERPRMLHLGARYTTIDLPSTPLFIAEAESLDVDLGYTHQRAGSPHAFRVGYEYSGSWASTKFRSGSVVVTEFSVEGESHAFELGYRHYVLPRLAIGGEVGYSTGEDRNKVYGNTFTVDTEEWQASIGARWLQPLGGDRWLALDGDVAYLETRTDDGNWSVSEDTVRLSAGATFYFTRRTGIALDVSHDIERESTALLGSIDHFFNERWAVNCGGGVITHPNGDDETVVAGLVRLRL